MYSVVLMAALTTTPAVPEWGRHRGGCMGGYACCGGCYGGYGYGRGCSGCWGGYGYGCSGCSGWGGYSYPAYVSYATCASCYGAAWGGSAYYGGCYGGYGCYGSGYGCYGSGYSYGYAPAYIAPTGGTTGPGRPAERIPGPGNGDMKKPGGLASSITVTVPAGAQLYVDGKRTDTRSATQEFTTPELAPGQMYAYTFRADVVREGRTQSETQRVVFRPGETVRVAFPNLTGNGTQTASR